MKFPRKNLTVKDERHSDTPVVGYRGNRHVRSRIATLLDVFLFTTALVGCASHNPSSNESHTLCIADDSGRPISAFAVTVKEGAGEFSNYSCGLNGPTSKNATCTNDGLVLKGLKGPINVTVKARGYSFFHGKVKSDTSATEIGLVPLPPFEHSADYDTGFDADTGRERFKKAAVLESTELGPSELVKFYIANVQTTPTVYFQNTKQHQLHYLFARDVLKQNVSLTQFESETYHGTDRKAIAGTILFRPNVKVNSEALGGELHAPISVTFFPSDDLTPEQAIFAHRLIEERIGFASLQGGEIRVVYEPAGSVQESTTRAAASTYAEWGSLWLTLSEIYGSLSEQLLNPGLAYGTLKVLTPEQLETDVVSYRDILVLPRLPLKLPIVGGTITEELQTPLAHVNIAARTRGTPNIALKNASNDPRVVGFLGKLVRFEVRDGTFSISEATLEEAEQFWKSGTHAPYAPKFDDTTEALLPFDTIGFGDAIRVGVKAANLAELSHLLGNQAPNGFAVPFYFYNQFMRNSFVTSELCAGALTDCPKSGRTQATCNHARDLCLTGTAPAQSLFDYVSKLLDNDQFNSDTLVREATLAGLRFMIKQTPVSASFASMLDAQVKERFGAAKARIRSSTNSEDLDDFSGAGLYDSEGVNQAQGEVASQEIRKVWASVWNWRAFEERSFWSIEHLAVRMGCAVHQAFTAEAANGVLITQNIAEPAIAGMYVNVQKGEISVTNPTDGALPEVFSIIPAPTGVQVQHQRFSSLSPDVDILSDDEVAKLYRVCELVQNHFASLYNKNPNSLTLDIEFKFNLPDRNLVLKQVRPYTANEVR